MWYDIWYDTNRNGGGIRKDLWLNTKTLHCKEIENLITDIILPKLKPITIGVFYRPEEWIYEFMDLMVKKISNLNLKDNEIYLLVYFNINRKYSKQKKKHQLPKILW